MSALSTSGFLPDRPPLHLPYVDEEERDIVLEEITDLFDDLPTLCLTVAQKHIREDQLDVPTNERVFAALVALVETMLDEDGPEIGPEQHGQLLFLTLVPGVTFAVALQVAFGAAMADANVPRFAELTACLERVGLDADGDVVLPQPPPTFAPLARVLRGEVRRAIDIARVRRGIQVLRLTAALAPALFDVPIFCVLAWLHWAGGRRPLAMAYLAAAQTVDPGSRMVTRLSELFMVRLPLWLCE